MDESIIAKNQKAQRSYSAGIFRQKLFRNIICIFFAIISILPFLMMLMNATRTSSQIQQGISLFPSSNFLANWKKLMELQNGMKLTIGRSMINSLMISAPATFCAVYFSAMTAYGIHVYDFKLKKLAWAFILGIMMIPNQITVIGYYKMMLRINMIDNYLPLILPAIAAPIVVFFMKEYMESTLSYEMIEAARIDGAGEFRTFNTIIIPLMKPALATQAIFQFVLQWNNLFMPTILLTSEEKKTLPLFVQMLTADNFKVDYGVVYMGLFATVIPIIIAYLILSRYIVAGVSLGGVKG